MNQFETPKITATTVIRENGTAWWVECEHEGCNHIITVGKTYGLPSGVTVTRTAPAARRCGLHGRKF